MRLSTNAPPNTRVQRTRSSASPLRSPLTRRPQGMSTSVGAWPSRLSVRWAFLIGLLIVAISLPVSAAALGAFRIVTAVVPRQKFEVVVPAALGVAILLHFGIFMALAWLIHRVLQSRPASVRSKAMIATALVYTIAMCVIFLMLPAGAS
jgi:formate hydrogenlyase subunit 3/multisubunit Na+/H+ antiporter MnhD subunit